MDNQTVSARVGAETVYVTGTVNGQPAEWQAITDGLWRATVPRSDTGRYELDLECWDELGRVTRYQTTIRYGLYLITDRTQADVTRAKYLKSKWVQGQWTGTVEELAEYWDHPKGFYNAEDLNRVGYAVQFLVDLLLEYGYGQPGTVQPRQDWSIGEIPSHEDMGQYLENIRELARWYCVLPTTPALPESMDNLGYQEANAIEQILVDMYVLIQNMAASFVYSGEVYAGEV